MWEYHLNKFEECKIIERNHRYNYPSSDKNRYQYIKDFEDNSVLILKINGYFMNFKRLNHPMNFKRFSYLKNFKSHNEKEKNNIFNYKIIFSVLDLIMDYSTLLNQGKWDMSDKNEKKGLYLKKVKISDKPTKYKLFLIKDLPSKIQFNELFFTNILNPFFSIFIKYNFDKSLFEAIENFLLNIF